MELGEALSIIGAVTGPLGFGLSLLVYFRDKARVLVSLQFDMQGFGSMPKIAEQYFVVTVYNIGRRTIYLSHAHLKIPHWAQKELDVTALLLGDGIDGTSIPEGGPPKIIGTKQTDMTKYGPVWAFLRAAVIDAAGRTHYSDWPTKKPGWAGDHELRWRVRINRARNWLRHRFGWG